ncbi:MAG: N-acetyl-alpha-D-glucosaminyl L-malate synthase BshA [Bacteroidota bacterium]|nr:N-acetyl-alpha-D-glucosaminyl L-malate synthase BshA [Bacteroidota bacterium]
MSNRNLNIGIVCYPTYGGSGVVATELGMALAKKGHNIHFLSYKRPARLGHFQTNIFFHEVSPFEYPLFEFKPYDTALASKIVDIALYNNLDILHVHYAIPHATIAFLAREILKTKGKYIPVVTTLHGTDITLVGSDRSFFPVVEFSINQSDGVTAVSHSLKQQTLDIFSIENEIEVIPNFIDFARFNNLQYPDLRKQFASQHEKILIHVSNFRKVKRIDDIIHVYNNVQKQIHAILILVGDGPEMTSLMELSRELNLEDKIFFLGKQDAVQELLAISDLFFLTSDHESFGLAALEAMACGVPVMSSNIGGLTEVNIHDVTGYVCNVGDIESMSNYALRLLKDEKLLEQFKRNASVQAEQFDIYKILPMYENYYRKFLKN